MSVRSIYRDIDTLRALGAPVEGQAGVGYQLGSGFFLPDLTFSADEADALVLGLGWVRQRRDRQLAASSDSALAKIEAARGVSAAVPLAGAPTVAAASASTRVDPPDAGVLRDAVRRQHKVTIRYRDLKEVESERQIWPIAIVYFDDVRLLAAWCEERAAFRHFRIDRLVVTAVLAERYPERRSALVARWRAQDRDWRTLLTKSDTAVRHYAVGTPVAGSLLEER
ncbi:helix-turn-helix transcriptional regulator [Sphingomonas guangdongensis]|nr:WYL domain-containing protein [Sphingomonas guangdongensis]